MSPPNVATPVPPWSTPTIPVDVRFSDASVKTTLEGSSVEKLMVPEEDIPVAPLTTPSVDISMVSETSWNVPVALPIVVEEAAPDASVVTPVEDRSVNAPVPGVTAPIEVKLASPVPDIFQSASLRIRLVPDVRPIVTVPVDVPVPILVARDPEVLILVNPNILVVPVRLRVSSEEPMFRVSAVVLSEAMLTVLPPVPEAMLTVLALFPVPRLTAPVVPESKVSAPVPLERREMALLVVEGEITGLLPENVRAVDVNVLVLIVPVTPRFVSI